MDVFKNIEQKLSTEVFIFCDSTHITFQKGKTVVRKQVSGYLGQ